jgi:aerobic-type carbon monoxide dehydrogenase small subunit (CoxS/CutS family)
MTEDTQRNVSRRNFIKGVIATGAAVSSAAYVFRGSALLGQQPSMPGSVERLLTLNVNGQDRRVDVMKQETLAMTLRYKLGLTGTKLGCDRSECGACTVLVDDKPIYSCSYLAVWVDGRTVLTVEGLTKNGKLDPLQEAFIAHDAPQCGFCTSGQLMSAKALLLHTPRPTPADVRTALAGNLCRCSNYNRIVEAVVAAGAASSTTRTQGGAQ